MMIMINNNNYNNNNNNNIIIIIIIIFWTLPQAQTCISRLDIGRIENCKKHISLVA